jgi:C-terminal processing protease CtpA/Prc
MKSPLQKFCNDQVKYGHIDETTGYLRILSFSGFSDADFDFASDLAKLEKALDTVFSDPNLKRLVIDVRCCSGGLDPYGLAIASRLTAREYLAYTKVARADPVDRNKWTPGERSLPAAHWCLDG